MALHLAAGAYILRYDWISSMFSGLNKSGTYPYAQRMSVLAVVAPAGDVT